MVNIELQKARETVERLYSIIHNASMCEVDRDDAIWEVCMLDAFLHSSFYVKQNIFDQVDE